MECQENMELTVSDDIRDRINEVYQNMPYWATTLDWREH